MKLYGTDDCQRLINRYVEKDGSVYQIREGVLGLGLVILQGLGLKTIIIREVPLNCWSSAHHIRCYNKTPKNYQKMIDEYTGE